MGGEGIDAVGEAVTGGLAARAVEPEAGEEIRREGHCLNCGTPLAGPYCQNCGQRAHIHRSLTAFWHDLLHSVLHFEGKIWRTLPRLAWRPGELTRRYIEGERARFVSPMALFLFSVFLMFAVLTAVGGPFASDDGPIDRMEAAQDIQEERDELREKVGKLRAERSRLGQRGGPTGAVDLSIATLEVELKQLEETRRVLASGSEEEVREALDDPFSDIDPNQVDVNTGWPPLDQAIRKALQNPSLLLYKIQTNAYKFSWALIPISVPFVWLLFLHRRRYRQYRAYDHTVFVTYSIAFMSLGFIALSLIRPIGLGDGFANLAIMIVPPVHMFRQLKGAYRLSAWSALWRTFALLNFAFIAGSLFFILLVALGAFA